MRFRREDDRLELTATLVTDESGKQTATMTSTPKAGIGVEDLLGAIIKLTAGSAGTDTVDVIYATLTSASGMSKTVGGKTMHMLIGSGTISHLGTENAWTITFLHTEMGEIVDEALTVSVPTTASDGS